ncbi:gamma-butyrobetaine dioxygenase-like [Acanthaster planci]|uniref:Gamma-butyrobetaine dioxygenase-like n=1 Tax=Acanthaster planci TaxID=133434 RepID=A0A8B7XQ52_ACAPL|nr:gamma-butyrobetaine dioxygenase-like [Acanthaster planci]
MALAIARPLTLARRALNIRRSVLSLRQSVAPAVVGGGSGHTPVQFAHGTSAGQHPSRKAWNAASIRSVLGSLDTRMSHSTLAAPERKGSLRFESVARDDTVGCYRVGLSSGPEGVYPYVWLRDNCRCPECYHPSSGQRTSDPAKMDPDIKPASEEIRSDGKVLQIIWPDGHLSEFDVAWLSRQRFSNNERDTVGSPELEMWGGELNDKIPTFDFQKVLHDDRELYNWLEVLNTKGLVMIKGAPTRKGVLQELSARIAYVKTTNYGETFQVFSKHDASNLAFTTKALCLHTDLPYYDYTPGIQMLHCIMQTSTAKGGESQFVDGLMVAEQIRQEFPEMYKILRSQEVDFRDVGEDYYVYHMKQRRPVIEYNSFGEFTRVNFNNHTRAPYMSLPVEKVRDMYKALKVFYDVMYRPENHVNFRLELGDIAAFNNGRVLHGRSSFTITKEGNRHLEGSFLDWDETHSRMRVLREKLFGEQRM